MIQHLAAAGVPFARFDAAQFPMEISFTAILHADGGWRACLGGIRLGGLRSIYYRRPRRFTFDPAIPTEQVNWCEEQAPAAVAHGVRQLMCSLELAFGALDFEVDDAGSWWFYEINPNGQWLWIEQQTGLPISAALAELLGGRPCIA